MVVIEVTMAGVSKNLCLIDHTVLPTGMQQYMANCVAVTQVAMYTVTKRFRLSTWTGNPVLEDFLAWCLGQESRIHTTNA